MLTHHQFYMRAFWHLSRDRPLGEVYGPIPWSSMVHYSDRCGLTGVSSDLFVEVISALDNHWLLDQHKERKAAQKRANAGSGSREVP